MRVRAPNTVKVTPGETIGLAFDPERVVVFDPQSGRAQHSALFEEASHG